MIHAGWGTFPQKNFFQLCDVICFKNKWNTHFESLAFKTNLPSNLSLLPTDCIISFGLIMMNLKQSTFGEKFILACGSDWKVKKLHRPLLSSERVSEWLRASSGKRQGAQVCLSDVLFLQWSHQDSTVVCVGVVGLNYNFNSNCFPKARHHSHCF